MFDEVPASRLPVVTAEQMREVDRVMVEDLGVTLVQMMENAGRHLAEFVIRRRSPRSVVVLAGTGGNGGGGLAAARHLANRGVEVSVVLSEDEERLGDVPRLQLGIVRRMGIEVRTEPSPADAVVDALLGYSLSGDPRGRAEELIAWGNASDLPICALDLPSGLDATSGRVGSPCVHAEATLTLAAPKAGLFVAPRVVGELYVADISVPPAVFAGLGLAAPPPFPLAGIARVATEPDLGLG